MEVTTELETIINLSAVEQYENVDQIILDKLRVRYEGKCEQNILIKKVVNIIKRSLLRLSKNQLNGVSDVSVRFQVEAIIYYPDDILTGCEVIYIDTNSNTIGCKHKHAIITVKNARRLVGIEIGHKLTLKVGMVNYLRGKSEIVIQAAPYSYSFKFKAYEVDLNAEVSLENAKIITYKLKLIENEEKQLADANKKIVAKFIDMYYPFKTNFPKDKFAKKMVNMLDLAKKLTKSTEKSGKENTVFLIRHTLIDKSEPLILQLDDLNDKELFDPEKFQVEKIYENPALAVIAFLNDYYGYVKMLREMAEIYNEQEINKHSRVWNIYEKLKQ